MRCGGEEGSFVYRLRTLTFNQTTEVHGRRRKRKKRCVCVFLIDIEKHFVSVTEYYLLSLM